MDTVLEENEMIINRKKLAKTFVISIVVVIAFFSALYIVGLTSEPYKMAQEFICSNATIKSHIGKNVDAGLALFGYSMRFTGPHGWAEYEINVKGEKGHGKVYVTMQKVLGKWDVKQAQLELPEHRYIPILVDSGQ